jgi:hypothetical protein
LKGTKPLRAFAVIVYEGASSRVVGHPDISRSSLNFGTVLLEKRGSGKYELSENQGGLSRSMQHWLGVY